MLLRRTVIGVQIGLSLLLLVGAGLFVRTLKNLRTQDVGYGTDHLAVFGISPRLAGYTPSAVPAVGEQVVNALKAVPGVLAVGLTNDPELAGNSHGGNITLEHYTPAPEEELDPEKANVSASFFSTLRIPLLAGREFAPHDDNVHPLVAIVNANFAKRYFGSAENALGQRLVEGGSDHPKYDTEIVGVVGDIRHTTLRDQPLPSLFRPALQATGNDLNRAVYVYVRGALPPETFFASIRRVMANVDANLAMDGLHTMEEQVESSLLAERLIALLAAAFGLLASVLAGIGLYGVLAFVTAQRTREIGVRMAMGASRLSVSRLILADVLRMVLGGLALGLPVALGLSRLRSQLFGVSPADPPSISIAVGLLAVMALLAAALPTQRAAAVNPTEALRME